MTVKCGRELINVMNMITETSVTMCRYVGDVLTVITAVVVPCIKSVIDTVMLLCIVMIIVVLAAGYVWAYNTQIYYQDIGTDDETIAWYMSWIPLVWGCVGVTLGGFISDRIVKRLGPYARLGVLITSQVSSMSVLLRTVPEIVRVC